MADVFITTVPFRGNVAPSPSWQPSSGSSDRGGNASRGFGGGADVAGSSTDTSTGSFASWIPGPIAALAFPFAVALTTAAVVVSGVKLVKLARRFTAEGEDRSTLQSAPRARAPSAKRGTATGDGRGHRSPAAGPATPGGSPATRAEGSTRYKKDREIGRGAFGCVYVGMNVKTGEMVAIKEMEKSAAEELRVEYSLLSGLSHPHVVNVLGFEIHGQRAQLILEWVAGGSLCDILKKYGHVEEKRLKKYVRQIVLGLQFLHDNGIIHRDIKPRNILVDHKGNMKLTDFGLSRHLETMNDKTRPCGTPVYMAPECPKGQFSVGSDIWAVGATMVELVTGQLPWSHISPPFDNHLALLYHIGHYAGQRGHHPHIPATLSSEAQAFLKVCFAPRAVDRGTCATLLEHPFLRESCEESSFISEATTASIGSTAPSMSSPGNGGSPLTPAPQQGAEQTHFGADVTAVARNE